MGSCILHFFYVFVAYVKYCGIDSSLLFGLFVKKYKIGVLYGVFSSIISR